MTVKTSNAQHSKAPLAPIREITRDEKGIFKIAVRGKYPIEYDRGRQSTLGLNDAIGGILGKDLFLKTSRFGQGVIVHSDDLNTSMADEGRHLIEARAVDKHFVELIAVVVDGTRRVVGIVMPRLSGVILEEFLRKGLEDQSLSKRDIERLEELKVELRQVLRRLHDAGSCHGDLMQSVMVVRDKSKGTLNFVILDPSGFHKKFGYPHIYPDGIIADKQREDRKMLKIQTGMIDNAIAALQRS